MAECTFHPGVETNVTCAECDRPICPKDMVPTPVGFKCKDCARPTKGQVQYVKPRQLAYGAVAAFGVALPGGLLMGMWGLGFFYIEILYGVLIAEAARRASGGHRGPVIAGVAGAAAAAGSLLGGFGTLGLVLSVAGAVGYALANRW